MKCNHALVSAETVGGAREHGRDRRKRLTRLALRRSALDLGLEHGWDSVSVEAIAERAGVSTRTFFNYFPTKEDAALYDVFDVSDAQLGLLAEGPPPSAWRDLTEVFVTDLVRATEDGVDFARVMQLQHASPVVAGRQLAVFARCEVRLSAALTTRLSGVADGRVRAALMVGCCLTAVRVALGQWALDDRRGSIRPHLEHALAQIEPAFGPSRGSAEASR